MCGFVAFLTSQAVDADTESMICPLPGWALELLAPLPEGMWGIVLGSGLLSLTGHAGPPVCPVEAKVKPLQLGEAPMGQPGGRLSLSCHGHSHLAHVGSSGCSLQLAHSCKGTRAAGSQAWCLFVQGLLEPYPPVQPARAPPLAPKELPQTLVLPVRSRGADAHRSAGSRNSERLIPVLH